MTESTSALLTYATLDRDRLTPVMSQYVTTKDAWPDCLLAFRLGDFYELFFDDAYTVSSALALTLTKKQAGGGRYAPMCGVPHHAADAYLHRLVEQGHKVAICEQLEDPREAKGLVKRDVVRVLTPGTIVDPEHLTATSDSWIAVVYQDGIRYGLAACDVASGHFETTTIPAENARSRLRDELARLAPRELLGNALFLERERVLPRSLTTGVPRVDRLDDTMFDDDAVLACERFQGQHPEPWLRSSVALLGYIARMQRERPDHIGPIAPYALETFMQLDDTARLNLELTETIRERTRQGSLVATIDRCQTTMGSRRLQRWLTHPLIDRRDITRRLAMVDVMKTHYVERQALREALKGLWDVERLSARIALGRITAKDLIALRDVLDRIPSIQATLGALDDEHLAELSSQLDPLSDYVADLHAALVDDPPLVIGDRPLLKSGYSAEVDRHRDALIHGQSWLVDFEANERQRTGVKSLKVGYNRIFGYYIEVSKANSAHVPSDYVRTQTLVNAERYMSDGLKALEGKILGAQEAILEAELAWFSAMKETTKTKRSALSRTADALATLDVVLGLATLAEDNDYVRPELCDDRVISITNGRHPVVERACGHDVFVPNDCRLDGASTRLLLITGPNMAGKSTYMRQVALIVLMAQMGSFVPADAARIGIVDRIVTRIGASDDLASGQSTFMVEMREVAELCRQATARSLVILDEVGRGTSTFDGLAIAWAVVEHIADPATLGCRALFATHYHELTALEASLPGVHNVHVDVAERDGEIVFLHRLAPGGSDDSYGVDVARLAGVPDRIVERAREVLMRLEAARTGAKITVKRHARPLDGQLDLFHGAQAVKNAERVLDEVKRLDLNTMTPIDALTYLASLRQRLRDATGTTASVDT